MSSATLYLLHQLQSFGILSATFNGVILWELVTCFPSEAKHIFWPEFKDFLLHRKLPPPASILLFNSRILAIPIIGITFALIAPSGGSIGLPDNFSGLFKAYVFVCSAAVFNGTAVFVIRTLAIRDSKRPMTIFLWCCYAAVCTFHLTCSAMFKMPPDMASLLTHKIKLVETLPWILFIGCSLVLDFIVLALSLAPQVEGLRWNTTSSQIARRFYFDAIMYFGFSLVVSTFNFAWIISHRYSGLLWALVAPIHMWLMVTISPRVIRNLRLHSAKQEAGASRDLSKERSPFSLEFMPYSNSSNTPSTTFIISKERTVQYPSSLYSNPNPS